MVIRGHQYEVKATLDPDMIRIVIGENWKMRSDGHIVSLCDVRLSHFVWFHYNGWLPTKHSGRGLVHKNGDILDYRIENLELRPRSAKIQLTPQVPEEGTVDSPSTGLPLGINDDSNSLSWPRGNA